MRRKHGGSQALLAALMIGLGTSASMGLEYHVAVNGNDANSGAREAPLRTLQRAADVARAGDTVLVRGGTYAERVVVKSSGEFGRPITFRPEPGTGDVVLKNPAREPSRSFMFTLEDKGYNCITGFTFADFEFGGAILIGGTNYAHDDEPQLARGNVISKNRFPRLGNPAATS